jgi:hypothetical protein
MDLALSFPRRRASRVSMFAFRAVLMALAAFLIAPQTKAQNIVGWGTATYGELPPPASAGPAIAVAGGVYHALSIRSDGSVGAWGLNNSQQCDVPSGLSSVVEVSAGLYHSLARRADGVVVAWGSNGSGERTVPSDLGGAISISAGSFFSVATRTNGTVRAWGRNDYLQSSPPASLTGVTRVAAGEAHALALTGGTVVGWGLNDRGQVIPPAGLAGVVQICAGRYFSAARRNDGSVVCWGENGYGQCNVPPALGVVSEISAGDSHMLALRPDGSLVTWGYSYGGLNNPPSGLANIVAISGGGLFSLVALDLCPADPGKVAPGACGCGTPETGDTDSDGAADCNDADDDDDGVPDASDGCPLDPLKTAPGACGCGAPELDSDADGAPNCVDADDDNDGVPDASDGCPLDPTKSTPGTCGCGVSDADSDGDGTKDCLDGCPNDPLKTTPQQCGCGVPEGADSDGDGARNCVDQAVVTGRELVAVDGAAGDRFGSGIVAMQGDLLVGAAYANIAGRVDQGAVYVFRKNGAGVWQQVQKLVAASGAAGDLFGTSLDGSGSHVIVGAPSRDLPGLANAGAAFVFERLSNGTWIERATLTAQDARADDEFGSAVSMDGSRAAIAAHKADIGQTASGAVYVFSGSGVTWTEEARLVPTEAESSAFFGIAVDISGDFVIGASNRDSVGTIPDAGSATVFRRDASGAWVQDGRFEMPGLRLGDYGNGVSIDGATAFLGSAWGDVGANGQQGYGWIYTRDPAAGWVPRQKIVGSDSAADDYFGAPSRLVGDLMLVGAPDDSFSSAADAGSAYLFQRVGAQWTQLVKLRRPVLASSDYFGSGLGIDGDTVIVGARYADIGAAADQGAIYLFDLDCDDDGAPDTDFDGDLALDCDDADDDGDGMPDELDACPFDSSKTAPGLCGCGVAETDTDGDIVPDCVDPDDDGDGILDEDDACPLDPLNADTDGDGQLDCADADDDNDGTPDASDGCPGDSMKTTPGQCGCGVAEGGDSDGDGVRDCVDGITGLSQRIFPPQPGTYGRFGQSIDADGEILAVGAPGIGGAQPTQGRVFIYRLGPDEQFTLEASLVPAQGTASDLFGNAVDLVGHRLYVGAPAAVSNAGLVYVFERSPVGVWQEVGTLQSSSPAAGAQFGSAIACDGFRLVVGAPAAASKGSIEIFMIGPGATFAHQTTLVHPLASNGDQLGYSVSIDGNIIAALAIGDDFPGRADRGSAWVTEYDGSAWGALVPLIPLASEGIVYRVGGNVLVDGQRVLVGVFQTSNWGWVEEFGKSNGSWTSRRRVRSNLNTYEAFGWNFAPNGDALLIGAPVRTGGGAVYRMEPDATGRFVQTHLALPADGAVNDYLGWDIAVVGGLVVASAPNDDLTSKIDAGSITVFDLRCASDSDGDGNADCADLDDDNDGVVDEADGCPLDPLKALAGACGCGVAEVDTDLDGTPDCVDGDDDGDGSADAVDGCPLDAAKTAPGACGCGASDIDTDGDGALDCVDSDDDGDGTEDTSDGCPRDPLKTAPGQCGCGATEGGDSDGDGVRDCVDGQFVVGTKILASNGATGDLFGARIALDDDLLVTGASQRMVGGLAGAGAVYFHRRLADGSWLPEGMVADSTPVSNARFGSAVAISGSIAAIGSPFDSVNGLNTGSVHVFSRSSAGVWVVEKVVVPPLPALTAEFGSAVALDGDLLVVGARLADSVSTLDVGSVWVFRRTAAKGGTGLDWTLEASLQPDGLRQYDRFGSAVALDDGLLVVGTPDRDHGAAADAGSVFVYRRTSEGAWQPEGEVRAANPASSDRFGSAVDLSGSEIVVGESGYDVPFSNCGRASIIRRGTSGFWAVEQVLQPAVAQSEGRFGSAVAISDSLLVIGESALNALPGSGTVGRVHVFYAEQPSEGALTRWDLLAVNSDASIAQDDLFGSSVALGGEGDRRFLLSSSPRDDELGVTDRGSVTALEIAISDCDGNGLLDSIEIAFGAGDCDGNGVLDVCEGFTPASHASPEIGPIGGSTPVQFSIPVTARATSDVTLSLRASANLAGTSRFLLVSLDGGPSTVVFNGAEGDCAVPPNTASIVVPKATWNAAAADGSIVVRFTASPTVSSAACGGTTFVGCSYAYTGIRPEADCNSNGVLDRCEGGAGFADCNRNGLADACEISSGSAADADADGVPDACEATVRVGPTAAYPTVGDALAAAFDGWTIEIEAGVYRGFTTRGRSVTLRALGGPGEVVVDADGAMEAIRIEPALNGGIVALDGIVARGASGRGVLVAGGTARIDGVRVTSNAGGGIEVLADAVALIEQSRIDGNAAIEGAGLLVREGGTAVLTGTRVEGNAATQQGGGLRALGTCVLESCTFEGNTAGAGGSAVAVGAGPSEVEIAESDFCRHAQPAFQGSWTDLGGNRIAGDCNANGTCDLAEIDAGAADVDGDYTLDSCEPDCDGDAIPDDFEIANGVEADVDSNGVPDRCQPDCDSDGLPNAYEIAQGAADIDANGVPDVCQPDCDGDGRPDTWELATGGDRDCNGNGVIDSCDISAGTSTDCNVNGVPDSCDLASGTSTDINASGRPDECELVVGGTGYATPQAAIDAAPTGSAVEIASGTYGPVSVFGKSLTLRAIGAIGTVVFDGAQASRPLHVGAGAIVTCERIVLRNGRAVSGAGALIESARGNFIACVFENNIATSRGGGLRVVDGTLEALQCAFTSNAAAAGGAVALDGVSTAQSRLVDCTLRQNSSSGRGGAVTTDVSLEILRTTVESNTAGALGAALDIADPAIGVSLRDSRFCLNQPSNVQGLFANLGGNVLSDDCDADGACDADEIASGAEADCNANGILDDCDVDSGLVPDCNDNGIPDSCDIAAGTSNDIEPNGVPDECKPDCDGDGLPDAWEISQGLESDCDVNGVPDACDIALGAPDCDEDGLIDACEISSGTERDCNESGTLDRCEIVDGASDDDGDGELDSCNFAQGDFDLDDEVGAADLSFLLVLWGTSDPPFGDLDGDGLVGASDLSMLLANWGSVP